MTGLKFNDAKHRVEILLKDRTIAWVAMKLFKEDEKRATEWLYTELFNYMGRPLGMEAK